MRKSENAKFFTKVSSSAHQIFTQRLHAALVMNQDIIKQVIRWSARLVTLLSYVITCGLLVGGLALMGCAFLLFLFSRDGGAALCFLCGCAFTGVGALALVRQLRGHSQHIRQQLKRFETQELSA